MSAVFDQATSRAPRAALLRPATVSPELASTPGRLHEPAPESAGDRVLARAGHLSVGLACSPDEIEAALRLRFRVFAGEMGAQLDASEGIDRDIFDPYCRHLVVRDERRDEVVGTYRLLEPDAASEIGCLYSDREFWLTRLNPIRDSIVELGRSCVDPNYRSGATIMLLWSGLGALLADSGHGYLLGCVSVPLLGDPATATRLYRRIAPSHLSDETLRVWPRERLDFDSCEQSGATDVAIPPLMKGYLKAGARLLGEPHLDREFGCADFPMLLDLSELASTHRRRFMR